MVVPAVRPRAATVLGPSIRILTDMDRVVDGQLRTPEVLEGAKGLFGPSPATSPRHGHGASVWQSTKARTAPDSSSVLLTETRAGPSVPREGR